MDVTCDGFVGGRLQITQPKKGFRAGSDAVLLAASVEIEKGQNLLDVGSGVGTAAICVASRIAGSFVTGLELQEDLAELSHQNAKENGLSAHSRFYQADIADRSTFAQLKGPNKKPFLEDQFEAVISNPPFYEDGKAQLSPNAIKSTAHVEGDMDLASWIEFCVARLKPKGQLSLIHRTDRLPDLVTSISAKCGSLKVIPLWPNRETAAKRVIVTAVKGDKGPLQLLPGLVLHEMDGKPTDVAEKILRHGAGIAEVLK